MAGIKISALPAVSSTLSTDIFPVVQAGVTSRETVAQLSTYLQTVMLPLSGGTMTGNLILNGDPTASNQAATKNYVDLIAQGITVQGACQLASTVALTVTYNNQASGVGATLTNNTTQAAFTMDGVTPSVGARILIKNQSSALQNGIYTLTNAGSISTNWVLTRATDYDLPAQINPGDLVVINQGTVNATTSWLQTATVDTIGTNAINFSQFSASLPLSLANGGMGASLTASNGGIFYSTSTAGAILSGTATARQMLQSGSSSAPAWSTTTWPATTTANRILYSSSTSVIGEIASAANGLLTTDGSSIPSITLLSGLGALAGLVKTIKTQIVSATGTYTASAGLIGAIVDGVGGGAGSGGAAITNPSQSASGSGGGGGGYFWKVYTAAQMGATAAVVIGAAGTAGAAGANDGGAGGNTTFTPVGGGAVLTGNGGTGGTGGSAVTIANVTGSVTGGAATGGDVNISGGYGNGGIQLITSSQGGSGGNSILGIGAGSRNGGTGIGFVGTGYGAGASGAANGPNNASGTAGAVGTIGIVRVIEFCNQ